MKTNSALIFLTLVAFVIVFSCTSNESGPPTTEPPKAEMSDADLVKRGAYLVNSIGCDDCHSPKIMTDQGPAPDPAKRLSGHQAGEVLPPITDKKMIGPGQWALFNMNLTAAVGPWGTSFAANLTPDASGIGEWSPEQFRKAIREGKLKGQDNGRALLPPMPWFNYKNLTDEDLNAMFAYLKSLPPVKNVVPAPIPPGQL